MALDLGGIITGLGTAYFAKKYAQAPTPASSFLPDWGDLMGGSTPALPVVDTSQIPPGMTSAGCPPGYMKRKTRKRRKRLATPSDLKDLAALKGVLGGGEAFKVWIATHS